MAAWLLAWYGSLQFLVTCGRARDLGAREQLAWLTITGVSRQQNRGGCLRGGAPGLDESSQVKGMRCDLASNSRTSDESALSRASQSSTGHLRCCQEGIDEAHVVCSCRPDS